MPLNPILRCNVMSNGVDINDPSSQLRINGLLLLTCSLLVVISFMDKVTPSISLKKSLLLLSLSLDFILSNNISIALITPILI